NDGANRRFQCHLRAPDESRNVLMRARGVDGIQRRTGGLETQALDGLCIQIRAIEVADLLRRAAGRRLLGQELNEVLHALLRLLFELRERIPEGAVLRNLVSALPVAVGVKVKIISGLDGEISMREIEPPGAAGMCGLRR